MIPTVKTVEAGSDYYMSLQDYRELVLYEYNNEWTDIEYLPHLLSILEYVEDMIMWHETFVDTCTEPTCTELGTECPYKFATDLNPVLISGGNEIPVNFRC